VTALFEVGPADVATTNDDWYTPRWIFDAAGLTFDLDVCAPVAAESRTCPARRYLTLIEDGLSTPWEGLVWMNPPFSNLRPWLAKWRDHADGLALVPGLPRTWLGGVLKGAEALTVICPAFLRPGGARGDLPVVSFIIGRGTGAPLVSRIAAAADSEVFAVRALCGLTSAEPRNRPPVVE
jgi:hypothetical protein